MFGNTNQFGGSPKFNQGHTGAGAGGNKLPAINDLVGSPTDTVTSLRWQPSSAPNPNANGFLLATSWDSSIRCWEVTPQGVATPKLTVSANGPLFDCAWSLADPGKAVMAGSDSIVYLWDLASNQKATIGQHAAPVKSVAWVESMNMICTGSWDKTVKYWDGRQPNPVFSMTLSERIYGMDVTFPLSVVICADISYDVIDLKNPSQVFKHDNPLLKHQLRCVANFPDKSGFVLGCIEGRCSVQYIMDASKTFSFRCHRDQSTPNAVYGINTAAFHPSGTFATGGSDGIVNYWDKDTKQKLSNLPKQAGPVTACGFNPAGTMLAFSVGYDWYKGALAPEVASVPTAVRIAAVGDDVQKQKKK